MYAKLVWRNIRRSLRDYGIYFLTLVFAVAIFYVFNSLDQQPAFLAMGGSTRRMAIGAVRALQWLTIMMTGVVGLLVLYANRVIIKKRSRELGTYLLLGMEPGRLALLLMAEITLIGMAALLVGQAVGIGLSPLFALLVGRIFHALPVGLPFVFSAGAVVRTLVTYGLIFVLVGLWQAVSLYRQQLINLIIGSRQNEVLRQRGRALSGVLGLLGLSTLGAAYWLADQVSRTAGLNPRDPRIVSGVILGVVGTYLLFGALAGLLTGGRQQRQRGVLARGLNRFVYRQVTAKINTHTAMLATIAVMLTITICAMAFGLGLGKGMATKAEAVMPFDYILISSVPTETFDWAHRALDQSGLSGVRVVEFQAATTEIRGMDLILPGDMDLFANVFDRESITNGHPYVIAASAYQGLRSLKGYPPVDLPEGTFLIHGSVEGSEATDLVNQAHQHFLASGPSLEVGGKELRPATTRVYTEPLGNRLIGPSALLVVPDAVAAGLSGEHFLVVQAKGTPPESLDRALASPPADGGAFRLTMIRSELVGQTFLVEGMLLFISGYIGVMFILISATLLALQQVTDAVEHRRRFEVLRKLGADEAMIDGAIARQVGLYFLTPVLVAFLHSLMAMLALARIFANGAGYTTVWSATLVTLGIFILVYGVYYLLTLQSCRTLFKEAQPE